MCDKCCATCGMRYYVDDDTVCCHRDPGCGVKPNAAGFYCFNIKQAEKSCCDHYWEQIVDHRYSTMDRVTETLPPIDSILAVASSRVKRSSVPVRTKV